jgi:hypothetical protein
MKNKYIAEEFCNPLKVNLRFGGIFRFYLQGRRVLLSTCFHSGFLLALFFEPEDVGERFPRNVG